MWAGAGAWQARRRIEPRRSRGFVRIARKRASCTVTTTFQQQVMLRHSGGRLFVVSQAQLTVRMSVGQVSRGRHAKCTASGREPPIPVTPTGRTGGWYSHLERQFTGRRRDCRESVPRSVSRSAHDTGRRQQHHVGCSPTGRDARRRVVSRPGRTAVMGNAPARFARTGAFVWE